MKPWYLIGPSGAGWDYPEDECDCGKCPWADDCEQDGKCAERWQDEYDSYHRDG